MEAEASGRYYQAANRYIDALNKDRSMVEARDRLMEVGDSAISQSLRTVDTRLQAGDRVRAGEEHHRIDGLLGSALRVGVRLPTPPGHREARRGVFDAAIGELMAAAQESHERRQWGAARGYLDRIIGDFEPSEVQRRESLALEARVLLDWALAEEEASHFRAAYGLAEEVLALREGAPPRVEEAALVLMDRALAAGTARVVVFPISETAEVEGRGEANLTQVLSDALELNHWRQPPPFIAVADPLRVRTVTRRITPPGRTIRPERIMDEVGGELGVLIDLTYLTTSQGNPRRRTRSTRTKEGAPATYVSEESTLRYEVHARILILDRDGRELEDFPVSENESGPFEWGIYEGNPDELDLSRAEARLFDPDLHSQQRAVIEESLIIQLAERVADGVYSRVLNYIR
jgi:hypothetical protein